MLREKDRRAALHAPTAAVANQDHGHVVQIWVMVLKRFVLVDIRWDRSTAALVLPLVDVDRFSLERF